MFGPRTQRRQSEVCLIGTTFERSCMLGSLWKCSLHLRNDSTTQSFMGTRRGMVIVSPNACTDIHVTHYFQDDETHNYEYIIIFINY